MWNMRTKTVPVIIGAVKTIKKGSGQNLQLLPDHLLAIQLQKITPMSTAHIICEVPGKIALISYEIWTYQKTTTLSLICKKKLIIAIMMIIIIITNSFFFSWHDSPLVGLGLLLIHEDFCGF